MRLTAEAFYEIVHSLRTDGVSPTGKETRRLPRVGARGRVDVVLPRSKGGFKLTVTVRDISAAGIGFLIGEPYLAVADEFVLILGGDSDQPRKGLVCRVRRVGKLQDHLYSVGASFRDDVSKEVFGNQISLAAAPIAGVDQAHCNDLEQRLRKALLNP